MSNYSIINFFRKVFAWGLEFLLAVGIWNFLLSFRPFFETRLIVSEIVGGIFKDSFSFQALLSSVFICFVLTLVLRLYMVLVFGTSLGHVLFLIKPQGGALTRRVLGVLRVILGPFGFLTRLKYKSSRIGFFQFGSIFLAYCLFSYLAIYSPLFTDFVFLNSPKVNFEKVTAPEIKRGNDFTAFRSYQSRHFSFDGLSLYQQGPTRLVPSLEIQKSGAIPVMTILNLKENLRILFKKSKSISIHKLVRSAKEGNFLFSFFYPELNKLEDIKRWPFIPKKRKDKILSELKQLLQSSFELGHKNLLSNGPFIRGGLNVREGILRLLPEGALPEISFVYLGDQLFLNLKQSSDNFVFDYYLPLLGARLSLLEFVHKNDRATREFYKNFEKIFLSTLKWKKMEKIKLLSDPFMLEDFFATGEIRGDSRKAYFNSVLGLYSNWIEDFVESKLTKDSFFYIALMDSLEKMIFFLKNREKKSSTYLYSTWIMGLVDMKTKLKRGL